VIALLLRAVMERRNIDGGIPWLQDVFWWEVRLLVIGERVAQTLQQLPFVCSVGRPRREGPRIPTAPHDSVICALPRAALRLSLLKDRPAVVTWQAVATSSPA
jgi:hypothetical protein